MADKTELQESADQESARSVLRATVGNAFMALPEGYVTASLEELQPRPNRIRTNYNFRDTKSLAGYLNRFQRDESIAFSSPDGQKILVVIDHHDHTDASPRHGDHVAAFTAQFTSRYKAWREIHGKPMSQVAAGIFLEERSVDVVEPDAAAIMEMVMQFDALKKVTFKQSTRLHDGQRQFTYNEENEVRGNVTLPDRVVLLVPVYDGQEPERVTVRVKYRIEDGALRFAFEIHEKQDLEREAFERCEDALQGDLDKPIMLARVV